MSDGGDDRAAARLVEARGPWGFTTLRRYRRPDGTHHLWQSRHHRKRLRRTGSIPFTTAAYLQLFQAAHADASNRSRALFGWRPKDVGWLSCALQFPGTVLFNFNTFDALVPGLDWLQQDLVVWVPDIGGLTALPDVRLSGLHRDVSCAFRVAPAQHFVVGGGLQSARLHWTTAVPRAPRCAIRG